MLPFFFPRPLPALLLAPFFARSLTLVPHSLLLIAQKRLLRRLIMGLHFGHANADKWYSSSLIYAPLMQK